MSVLYFPHSLHSFRNKIRESRRKWLKVSQTCGCENLFSNPSPASLAKILDSHVLFADSLEFIFFSPTLSEIECGWMSTSNSKSVALCTKNICSSKYFSLIPQQSMSWELVRLMNWHKVGCHRNVLCWLKNVGD